MVRRLVAVRGLPARRSPAAAVLDGRADREIAAGTGTTLMRPFEGLRQPGEIGRVRVGVGIAHLVAQERLHFGAPRVELGSRPEQHRARTLPFAEQCASLRPVGSISSAITPTTPVGWSYRWRSISARPSAATAAATLSCCDRTRATASRRSPSRCPTRRRSCPSGRGTWPASWPSCARARASSGRSRPRCRSARDCRRARRSKSRSRWPSATNAIRCDWRALCQRAEHRGAGVPCGIMDQLVVAAAVEGHALLIDCHSLERRAVRIPDEVAIYAVHCGEQRRLVGSAYADRACDCAAAETIVGPLREADIDRVERIADERVRRRARHVVTENGRVRSFAAAIEHGDYVRAGALMVESHRSLRGRFRSVDSRARPARRSAVCHAGRIRRADDRRRLRRMRSGAGDGRPRSADGACGRAPPPRVSGEFLR